MLPLKKMIVGVVGGTILLFGLALLVLPGPAFVVIPVGLAVLATEFVWARRWLQRARGMVNRRKARRTTRAVRVILRRRWDLCKAWWNRRRFRSSTAATGSPAPTASPPLDPSDGISPPAEAGVLPPAGLSPQADPATATESFRKPAAGP